MRSAQSTSKLLSIPCQMQRGSQKDEEVLANEEEKESSKRAKLIGSGPVAAAAMQELETKHNGEWLKLSKDQLIALCMARGLSVLGNKPDLAGRLNDSPPQLVLMPPPAPLPPPLPPPPPLLVTNTASGDNDSESDGGENNILGPA